MDPRKFLMQLVRDEVTILEVVPSYLSVLLDETAEQSTFPLSLHYLLVTGEEIKPHLVRKWFDQYPGIKMVNAYGPTEASDDITHYIMDKAPDMERIPIGKPLQNMNIYIVDKRMQLCPIGVKGEICVSGVGVGRGYIGDKAKTKQVFIKNPFFPLVTNENSSSFTFTNGCSPQLSPNNRLYKTGDMGTWLPDGTIEFFGRKDYQVKIRGFRIELGEIENRLLNHPEIKEAVVIDREDQVGNKFLCAYVVPDSSNLPEFVKIKEFLSEGLPDYMLPLHYIPLDKIPLTPNGKVDRKHLPEPELIDPGNSAAYIVPGNIIEKKLVETWQEVLGQAPVSINDNFFEIGGDSIKTIQIISRMRKAGYKLEMRDIFQNPQISALAPIVKKIERKADQSVITGTVPLTPIQKDFFENQLTDKHHYNQAVMLMLEEGFDQEAVKTIFTKIQEHHDALRMTYKEEKGKIIQTNHGLEYPLSLNVYDLRNQEYPGTILEQKANELQSSINLETGPLMKLGLFHLQDGHRLLIAIHHLVIDGISWRILFEDMA
jgi:aryl carrier-like protein